jgi:hypothetical protein
MYRKDESNVQVTQQSSKKAGCGQVQNYVSQE